MAIGSLIAGIATALASANASANATNLGYQNLAFQKERDKAQRRLATATRSDIYGNSQSYDDLLNEFIINLTPMQEAITKAGEREQLLSLTEDAQRNRDTRRRQERRATMPYTGAEDVYDSLVSGFLYDEPPDEDAIRGRNQLLYGAEAGDAIRQAAAGLGQQAIRLGRGGDFDKIINSIGGALSNAQLGTMRAGRQDAMNEATQRQGAHQQKHLPAMSQFAQLMDAVSSAPQMFGNLAATMGGQQSEIINGIARALSQGASGVGNAYSNAARLVGNSAVDFSGIGKGIDSLLAGATGGSSGGAAASSAAPTMGAVPSSVGMMGWPFLHNSNSLLFSPDQRLKDGYDSDF